ncbi:hypothetical protein CDAR_403971 [Caerostris darwini]|uniref:Uncharacterized protein n=1 Tax=Caerostris darwini TaxID=1538125 RepID=A0AAV4SMX6_9ARAC|nr:hypothetical protein CDAR_403971 [Caerostris darwini]
MGRSIPPGEADELITSEAMFLIFRAKHFVQPNITCQKHSPCERFCIIEHSMAESAKHFIKKKNVSCQKQLFTRADAKDSLHSMAEEMFYT